MTMYSFSWALERLRAGDVVRRRPWVQSIRLVGEEFIGSRGRPIALTPDDLLSTDWEPEPEPEPEPTPIVSAPLLGSSDAQLLTLFLAMYEDDKARRRALISTATYLCGRGIRNRLVLMMASEKV
jgi:hypothetical protein